MVRIPAESKKGFWIVIGALVALYIAAKVQERIG